MTTIKQIEDAVKVRLSAEITGITPLQKAMRKPDGTVEMVPVKVESYPKNPNEQTLLMLAESGAIVVRYAGSKFGVRREVCSLSVQDRTMFFDVLVFSKSLREDGGAGIYELLDGVALRLTGFLPAGAVDGIELVQDESIEERKGAWSYGLLVSVKTQIERVV